MTGDLCRPVTVAIAVWIAVAVAQPVAFLLDGSGFPIFWQPQKGLLFSPKETYDVADVSDDLSKSFPPDNEPVGRSPKVIGIHAGHDASIAIKRSLHRLLRVPNHAQTRLTRFNCND